MRAGLVGVLVAGLAGLAPAPAPAAVQTLVVPAASSSLPATWHEVFHVGYGRKKRLLGTSRGGDSGTLRIGPEYGAPGPDGSWWFLDAAKQRLAHYSRTGRYLGQVRIPQRLLVGGRYFQWQLPHVLANGWLVAQRLTPSGTSLLRLRDDRLDEIRVAGRRPASLTYDDGKRLYGYVGKHRLVSVNPRSGAMKAVAAYRTPSGSHFTLEDDFDHGSIRVGSTVLPTRTTSGAVAHVGLEARVGADDVLHLFLLGYGDDHESVQLVGGVSVTLAGVASAVDRLPNPFSEADPGSPAHLVVAPGSSTPMLVYVLPDGVHVYARTGS
ncbi:MAG TPA: hypothetical protein VFV89_12650 [Nocardioides sp.]|uniref:DUF7485 domain-containing protein n=1 Tax=Nocardioides sp. TaxID=35761 RepID=UPI002E36B685|nr:hypothetical protein [Nocardioides sp.]HEX5088652.1 hypothetical protein [Nocardioides sp.]